MNQIELRDVVPSYFDAEHIRIESDVWNKALTINRGESYLVQATSGRGKSSLCSFIYGLRRSYNGSILFDSIDISSIKKSGWTFARTRSLSMLFQELRLFSELTAIENIELKNRLTHFKSRSEIKTMLEQLGIESKKDMLAGKLSLGEQQRVAFVRSLCQPFDFILLDEPVSHLDPTNGKIMATLLDEEAARQGAGVIVTSVGNELPVSYDRRIEL